MQRFVEIGQSVQTQVEAHWHSLGLDYQRRAAMGLALQKLLVRLDAQVLAGKWKQAHGRFTIGNRECAVNLDVPAIQKFSVFIEPGKLP